MILKKNELSLGSCEITSKGLTCAIGVPKGDERVWCREKHLKKNWMLPNFDKRQMYKSNKLSESETEQTQRNACYIYHDQTAENQRKRKKWKQLEKKDAL